MKTFQIFLTVLVLNILIFTTIYLYIPESRELLTREDYFMENLSATLFLGSFFISLICFYPIKSWKGRFKIGLSGLLGLVGFLDELSFGERHFGLTMPKLYDVKIDGLHDLVLASRVIMLEQDIGLFHPLILFFIAIGVILLLLLTFRFRHQLLRTVSFLVKYPPFLILSCFTILIFAALVLDMEIYLFDQAKFFEELFEMNAALASLFLTFSIYNVAVKGKIVKQQARPSLKIRALVVLFILAVGLPRLINLDHFATADEAKWVARAANFYEALAFGDFDMTYQKEHPGVTIMWAGMAGYIWHYPSYVNKPRSKEILRDRQIEEYLRSQGREPLNLLVAGRVFVVLLITMTLAASCFFATRLVGLWPALVGFVLIAFDPFHVALSRQLHLDALLSCMMLLSILAYLNYLYLGRRRRDLVVSALGMGLAWLTKLPGIYLVPFVTLVTFIELGRQWRQKRELTYTEAWQILWPWMALGIMSIGFFVLFWPSMWVQPIVTLNRIFDATTSHVVSGHDKAIFFNGQLFQGDPGWLFYPITYLWRTTPIVLIGLLLAGFGFIHKGLSSDKARRILPLLLLFVLVYTFFMTLGAKKFDRYLLPVYPVLDLMAGIGLAGAASWLIALPKGSFVAPGLIVVALMGQFLLMLPFYPYYLTYYNPLLGGLSNAPQVMQIGWGEGLDEAARYLNESATDIDQTVAISWYKQAMFSYFFEGQARELSGNRSQINELELLNSDYAVLYIHQWQRQLPYAEFLAFFDQLIPEKVIKLNGLEYAKIYDVRRIGFPDFIEFTSRRFIDWGGSIRLLAYELPEEPIMPGESLDLTFHLGNRAIMENNYSIRVSLVNGQGEEMTRNEGWPSGRGTYDWPYRDVWSDKHQIQLPLDTPDGYYRVEVGFYNPSTLERLSAADGYTGEPLGDLVTVDYLYVGDSIQVPADTASQQATFGEQINLLGTEFEGLQNKMIRPGETLPLRLFWQANQQIETDYTVFVHLVDPNGQIVSQLDQQPLAGLLPTTFWRQGEIISDEYLLQLPPDAPLGHYQLLVGMYDLITGQRLPISVDGQVIGDALDLGPFTIE